MRPDKKKRNRGKYVEGSKSEETQAQGKSGDSKVAPEKEQVTKINAEKSNEKSQADNTDQVNSSTVTSPANQDSNDSLPPPNLRRETDALKETKKPSKRQIFSDWKEYDQPILPEVVEEDQLHDFSYLIQQNIKEDNYFKFKHEKQWEKESCAINKDLFNLNLQALSAGLQCIPFYKRLNISTNLFSENEVKRMENYAKEQEKVYEGILDSQDSNPMYHSSLEKSTKEPDAQSVEKFDEAVEDVTSNMAVTQGGTMQSENELSKCLASDKQGSANYSPLIQAEESKVEVELNFFPEDNKIAVEDIASKSDRVEIKSHPSKEENDMVAKTTIISMASPVEESEVKPESKKEDTESIEKSSDNIPVDTDLVESSPMDMATVFESNPLGQRVKPQRSRDKKANKSKPKVDSPAEEDQILDSLLSLKEPTITADDSKKKEVEEMENEADDLTNDLKSIVIHDKKENLEDWLDSMLDD